jgi:hypothetical protein
LRAESLEFHGDAIAGAFDGFDFELIHAPWRHSVQGRTIELERALMTGAEESLAIAGEANGAAEMGAFGSEGHNRWLNAFVPTGSAGYLTQASVRSSTTATDRGSPATRSFRVMGKRRKRPSFGSRRSGSIRNATPGMATASMSKNPRNWEATAKKPRRVGRATAEDSCFVVSGILARSK